MQYQLFQLAAQLQLGAAVLQEDLSFNCQFKTFYIYKQLGTIIRCFVAQLKYYTVEYFGILILTTSLVQALQALV